MTALIYYREVKQRGKLTDNDLIVLESLSASPTDCQTVARRAKISKVCAWNCYRRLRANNLIEAAGHIYRGPCPAVTYQATELGRQLLESIERFFNDEQTS